MSELILRNVEMGQSLFKLINEICLQEATTSLSNRAIHRICTLMRKMKARTAILEDIPISHAEINREYLGLKAYHGKDIEVKIFRVIFNLEKIETIPKIKDLDPDSFLSDVIVFNFRNLDGQWRSYVFRAIVSSPKLISTDNSGKIVAVPVLNNYLHTRKKFSCKVEISQNEFHSFFISGTFFCQQNSVTSVCAHAALCMIINNMELPDGELVLPEMINNIIGIDHVTKKISPESGFTTEQVTIVLNAFRLNFIWMNFFDNPNWEFNKYIYSYVESGCPTLLVFTTEGGLDHIVPVLGHTLNSDLWRPEAESAYTHQRSRLKYKPTSAWVDHFIINDDNFGAYLCLPVDSLKRVTLPMYDPSFRARLAIIITPTEVTTPYWEAEYGSILIVQSMIETAVKKGVTLDDWTHRIYFSSRPPVVRTFLVKKDEYSKSLEKEDFEGRKFSDHDKNELLKDLPDLFWLSEITLPDLYSANKSKIIDFFYGCSNPVYQTEADLKNRWLQIRFPGELIKNGGSNNLSGVQISVTSHYPFLRKESTENLFDW